MRNYLAGLVLIAALAWFTPAALAGHGEGHGKGKGNSHEARERRDRDHDRDRDRWERRDNFEVRIYGDRDGRPPGWRQGEKVGWGNCGMPPGQAKKYGCRSYVYSGRRYYWYRDDVGRIIVRRPILEINAVIR